MNKDFSSKNGAIDYLTGLRKRIEDFSEDTHFYWEQLKRPQVKTLSMIPITGGTEEKGVLKHYRNKSYWKL